MTREEYLKNELIPEVKYVIRDKYIEVSSTETIFIQKTKPDFISEDDINSLFKIVKAKCKEQKIRLKGKQEASKQIKEYRETYEKTYEELTRLFNELTKVVERISEEGLHYGAAYDELLDEAHEIEGKMDDLTKLNTTYSVYVSLFRRLKEILYQVKSREGIIWINI